MMLAIMLAMFIGATATIPAGYYSSLDGKSGQALKNAIHELALRHTVLSYYSLWNYFPETDCYPDNKNKVWDMYSNRNYYFTNTYGMNREHSLPKSWWAASGANENTDLYPSYTDIMHLYPADAEANSAKLNWPLGEVSRIDYDNGVTKVGSPKIGQGGGASEVFEPDDRYKGDFARTYFYMACTYQHYHWRYTYQLTNDNWKSLNDWSIEMLCRWARTDAVSDKEVDRNDAVQRIQNNRNPFIDIPELFEYIWGDRQGQVFYLSDIDMSSDTTIYSGDPELVAPTQGTLLDFGEVAIGRSLEYTLYVKGRGLNNPLTIQLYRDDYKMFSIPVTSVSRTMANSAEGYPLTITYTPTTTGEHTARLLIMDGGLTGSVGVELRARCADVPMLTQLEALPASNVTSNGYIANWKAADEEVDYYIVTRNIYNKKTGDVRTEVTNTDDGNTTSYAFADRQADETHTYSVQSYRLGYTSEPSNVITIDTSGLTGIEADKPLHVLSIEGGILIQCSEDVGEAAVFDMSGRVVRHIENLANDMVIELPRGIYLLKTATSRTAWKVAVR